MICAFGSSMDGFGLLIGFSCRESWPVWIKISCWWSDLYRCRGSTLTSFFTQIPFAHSRGYSTILMKWLLHIFCKLLLRSLQYNYVISSYMVHPSLNQIISWNAACWIIPYLRSHIYVFTYAPNKWSASDIGRFPMTISVPMYLLYPSIYLFIMY